MVKIYQAVKTAWFLLFLGVSVTFAQRGVFNSAYKGNLSVELGFSSNRYSNSSLSLTGNEFSLTLNDAQFRQTSSGPQQLNLNALWSNQYKLALGYTIKRGVQVQLNLDNFKYQLINQVLNLDGEVNEGFDAIGGLSGTYNATLVAMDTIGFGFSSNSTKNISIQLNLLQNLFRTKSRVFVVNAVYGFGLGALHTTSSLNFGTTFQNEQSGISGFSAMAHGGLRIEFFRHWYLLPKISGGILAQNNIRMDISDASQRASQKLWVSQMSINIGTVFFLGKKENCDCPHF